MLRQRSRKQDALQQTGTHQWRDGHLKAKHKAGGQNLLTPGLQATVDALQQEQENVEGQVRDAHRKLAEANTELRTVRQEFKHQLEEQQAQFRAVEEETYNEREQQVGLPLVGLV